MEQLCLKMVGLWELWLVSPIPLDDTGCVTGGGMLDALGLVGRPLCFSPGEPHVG